MSTFELIQRFRIRLLKFHFDESVLLRSHSFAALPIVIHTGLVRLRREDCISANVENALIRVENNYDYHKYM